MAGEALAAMSAIENIQTILALFHTTLAITRSMCPLDTDINTILMMSINGQFDYVIVSAGTAGSVLARRLTECPNVNVLLLESGGCPPLESVCPGYFSLLPLSMTDYNMTAVDDGFSCQSCQGNSAGIIAGKMLGGTSSLHHMSHVISTKQDSEDWSSITGNTTWLYENILPYYRKMENLTDPEILTKYSSFHGDSGPLKLKKYISLENINIMAAVAEMGIKIRVDTNNNDSLGVVEPLLAIGDYTRQSSFTSYLKPVRDRSNLFVLTGATVSRVLLNEINSATGVEFTHGKNMYTVNGKEVILSAGAIKTPQILMLSGVGDPDHLESLGVLSRVDNVNVGENLQDHTVASILISLESDFSIPAPQDPFEYPVAMTHHYIALNKSQSYPDYQVIALVLPNNSTGLLQLCLINLQYKPEFCQRMYDANIGKKVLYAVPHALMPKSRGNIRLKNTDINTQPIVNLNLLNDPDDVNNLSSYLAHFSRILNTTYFKSIKAKFIDLGVCNDLSYGDDEFWKCYAVATSTTLYHYCSTCAIGSCLDNSFNVRGTSNLKVIDASAMPQIVRGNINAAVVMIAEKASDVIKREYGLSCSAN